MNETIKILCGRAGISVAELARRLDRTPQNFSNQLKRNDFRLSDLQKIAAALGYTFEYNFVKKEE